MKTLISLLTFGLLLLPGMALCSEGEESYGHLSYLEGDVTVIRLDGREDRGVVNLPVVPGDVIKTGAEGRCEIQFDNGTVTRLDKKGSLLVKTILAPSLTTSWKVTTLELQKGNLYTLSNNYSREIFQVTGPSASILLKSDSNSLVTVNENNDTSVFSERGKVKVMYGESPEKLKEMSIRRGESIRITSKNMIEASQDKDIEFLMWNVKINKHFEELHEGINRLPKPLMRYPRAVIDWAMRWSSIHGEWLYDDIFGLVWRPYLMGGIYHRPFFNADFVTVGDRLFVVPQEAWGWIPMYLGRWYWNDKKGWMWIPGNGFRYTDFFVSSFRYSFYNWFYHQSLNWYWMNYYDNWHMYHNVNPGYPPPAYNPPTKTKRMKGYVIPTDMRELLQKLEKASPALTKSLKLKEVTSIKPGEKLPRLNSLAVERSRTKADSNRRTRSATVFSESGTNFRDWNPDGRNLISRGIKYEYNSARNDIVAPELKLRSSIISDNQKWGLRMAVRSGSNYSSESSFQGSGSYSGGSDSGGSRSVSSSSSSSASRSHSDSSGGGTGKSKD